MHMINVQFNSQIVCSTCCHPQSVILELWSGDYIDIHPPPPTLTVGCQNIYMRNYNVFTLGTIGRDPTHTCPCSHRTTPTIKEVKMFIPKSSDYLWSRIYTNYNHTPDGRCWETNSNSINTITLLKCAIRLPCKRLPLYPFKFVWIKIISWKFIIIFWLV